MLKSRSINRTSFLVNMANIFWTKQTQSGVPKLILDCNQKSANGRGNRRQFLSHLSLLSLSFLSPLLEPLILPLFSLSPNLSLCFSVSCLTLQLAAFPGIVPFRHLLRYLAALSRLCLCLCSSNCIRQPVQLGAF